MQTSLLLRNQLQDDQGFSELIMDKLLVIKCVVGSYR